MVKLRKQYSEEYVLKKLGISDFRHLSKEKAMQFVSMLPQMDPEVAVKALEQFPQLKDAALSMAKDYKEAMIKAMDDDSNDVKTVFVTVNAIIDSLQKELERENIDIQERHYIIDQMKEVVEIQRKVRKDGQDFKLKVLGIGGGVVALLGMGLVAVLGASGKIDLPELEDVLE